MSSVIAYKSGDIYNKLMLTGKSYNRKNDSRRMVECICECGKVSFMRLDGIVKKYKSCGCIKTKHGMTYNNSIYRTWSNMKNRCYQPSHRSYKYYRDNGIQVCDAWKNDFNEFYLWAINNGWQEGLTLDRYPDQKGNYCPENCRWATPKEQSRNLKSNINITAFGETKCLTDWVNDSRVVLSSSSIKMRIFKLGWSPEKALTAKQDRKEKIQKNNRNITIFGETKSVSAWGRDIRCLVSKYCFTNRIYRGWLPEIALTTKLKK